jgi:CubicO group peptidase (beta-lactamase class C family)
MLPNNNDLRAAHSPLSEFVRHTAKVTPDFLPGTDCRYSSMGIAVLSLIMERLTDVSIRDLIAERLFRPLQMTGSWLGLPVDQADQLMPTVVPSELPPTQQADSDWNWNSRYWRCLGAPWGGMISTVEDLGRLAVMLLNQGCTMSGKEVLNPSVISASTKNQTRHMTGLSETDRRHRPWGLGWRLNWPDHATVFSDFLPFKAYGHWGATGTVMWIDPQSRRWCVILTNQPYEQSQSVLQRMSNVIATDDSYVT